MHLRSCGVALLAALLALAGAGRGNAAPIIRTIGGTSSPASIQPTVAQFQADLGGVNNGNAVGPISGGFRVINWDGGGSSATINNSPLVTFNTTVPRGAIMVTPGGSFEQAPPAGATSFANINAQYGTIFSTFSPQRVFSPLGSNVEDVLFFVPGTNIPAGVSGFGAVFTNVELPNTSKIDYFDPTGKLLLSVFAPVGTGTASLSFVGVSFNASEQIARVRITNGTTALGATANDNPAGGVNVAILDDFIFAEPQALPEPGTIVLLGAGLAGLAVLRRRRSRARGAAA